MLRLNWMLSHRMFRKMGTDAQYREIWERADCRVYRYWTGMPKDDPEPRQRWVRIEYLNPDGTLIKAEIYKVDDPACVAAINKLALPVAHIVATQERQTLEELTHGVANSFDKWFMFLANHPMRDIANDKVTISFNNQTFDIPMYSTDFLDATQRYLDELHYMAENNEW